MTTVALGSCTDAEVPEVPVALEDAPARAPDPAGRPRRGRGCSSESCRGADGTCGADAGASSAGVLSGRASSRGPIEEGAGLSGREVGGVKGGGRRKVGG